MENFEERKQEYLKLVESDEELALSLACNLLENKDNITKRLMMVVLSPQDERELRIAKAHYSVFKDLKDLVTTDEELINVPMEENTYYEYIINIFNNVDNPEELANIMNNVTPKVHSKMLFDYAIGCMVNVEDNEGYIASRTGLDVEDPMALVNWQKKYDKSIKVAEINTDRLNDIDKSTDKELDFFDGIAKEFHTLCESARVHKVYKI